MEFNKRLFTEWLSQSAGLSRRTIKVYSYCYGVIERYFKGKSFDKENISLFLTKNPRPYFRATILCIIEMNGLEIILPKRRVKLKGRKPIKYYSRDDLGSVLSAISKLKERDRLIFDILYYSGRRIFEVLNLKKADIDYIDYCVIFKTKGGLLKKSRIPVELADRIKQYCYSNDVFGSDDLFYPNKRGAKQPEESKYHNFMNSLQRQCEANKIPIDSLKILKKTHNFRRAVINFLIEEKGIEYAYAYIGHSKVDTTMVYAHERTKEKKADEAYDFIVEHDRKNKVIES